MTYTFEERRDEIFRFILENFKGKRYINYKTLKDLVYSLGADLSLEQNEEILRGLVHVLEAAGVRVNRQTTSALLDKIAEFFTGRTDDN